MLNGVVRGEIRRERRGAGGLIRYLTLGGLGVQTKKEGTDQKKAGTLVLSLNHDLRQSLSALSRRTATILVYIYPWQCPMPFEVSKALWVKS